MLFAMSENIMRAGSVKTVNAIMLNYLMVPKRGTDRRPFLMVDITGP